MCTFSIGARRGKVLVMESGQSGSASTNQQVSDFLLNQSTLSVEVLPV